MNKLAYELGQKVAEEYIKEAFNPLLMHGLLGAGLGAGAGAVGAGEGHRAQGALAGGAIGGLLGGAKGTLMNRALTGKINPSSDSLLNMLARKSGYGYQGVTHTPGMAAQGALKQMSPWEKILAFSPVSTGGAYLAGRSQRR